MLRTLVLTLTLTLILDHSTQNLVTYRTRCVRCVHTTLSRKYVIFWYMISVTCIIHVRPAAKDRIKKINLRINASRQLRSYACMHPFSKIPGYATGELSFEMKCSLP